MSITNRAPVLQSAHIEHSTNTDQTSSQTSGLSTEPEIPFWATVSHTLNFHEPNMQYSTKHFTKKSQYSDPNTNSSQIDTNCECSGIVPKCCLTAKSTTTSIDPKTTVFWGSSIVSAGDCSLHCCLRENPKASFEGLRLEMMRPAEGFLPTPSTAGLAMMRRSCCDSQHCYWWSSELPQGARPGKFPKGREPNLTVFYSALIPHPNPFQVPLTISRGRERLFLLWEKKLKTWSHPWRGGRRTVGQVLRC